VKIYDDKHMLIRYSLFEKMSLWLTGMNYALLVDRWTVSL